METRVGYVVSMTDLALSERQELDCCEATIKQGLTTFVEVGQALLTIRDGRLYRAEFGTFEDYCQERWDFTRMRASQLIAAAEVVKNVNHGLQIPTSERQVRSLAALPPEQQDIAWQRAVETAPNGKITAAHVQEIVNEFKPNGNVNLKTHDEKHIVYDRIEQGGGIVKCSLCNQLYDGESIEFCPYCAYTQNQRIEYLEHQKSYRHVSDDSYEWYTPAEYIEAARLVMGGIDLDPASCKEAQKVIKAKRFYTKEIDGLTQKWHGRIWLNPPYCMPDIEKFVNRTIDGKVDGEILQAIVLTNNCTDAAWFHRILGHSESVCFTRGRIKYWGPHSAQARQGQTLFYLGENVKEFIERFRQFGTIVRVA